VGQCGAVHGSAGGRRGREGRKQEGEERREGGYRLGKGRNMGKDIMVDCIYIGSDCSVSGFSSALSHRDHEL